jgi:hypothetical protein
VRAPGVKWHHDFARPAPRVLGYNHWGAFMKNQRQDWEQVWSLPVTKLEQLAPLIALGVAVMVAWL